MRKIIVLFLILALSSYASADVKDAIGNITKKVVKFSKEVTKGISDGVLEGRKSTESSDGSVVVTNEKEALKYIDVTLLSISPSKDGKETIAVFGFKNKHKKPVKITGLDGEGTLLAIDKNGYSNALSYLNSKEIIIPNEAAIKHSFIFTGNASEIVKIRLWTKAYIVK